MAAADPATGEAISYRIDAHGAVSSASYPGTALSFLRPDRPWDDVVLTTFCHHALHFTGPASAERWTAAHPSLYGTVRQGITWPCQER